MTASSYEKMTRRLRERPGAGRCIGRCNKILTAVTYAGYALLLITEFFADRAEFWRVFLVPAAGFAAVTIFRKLCNAKRPYEVLEIEPLICRDKKGESFPSRHAFSIFMIAMAAGFLRPAAGILYLCLGVLLAVIRVVGGVHFPRDVIAGAAIGICWGLIGFYII